MKTSFFRISVVTLAVVTGLSAFINDANAARGGGGGKKNTTTCRLATGDQAITVQAVVAESARRIRVHSAAGLIGGVAVFPDQIQVLDSAGNYVGSDSGTQAGSSYLEFFVEGLAPGRTYQVVASSSSNCASKSAPVSVTMPPQVAEAVQPKIFDVSRTGWWGGTPAIRFSATDDTAVASFRVFIDGVLLMERTFDSAEQWFRGWSNTYWCLPGSSFWSPMSTEYAGKLANVEIQVTDVLGNQAVHTSQIQF